MDLTVDRENMQSCCVYQTLPPLHRWKINKVQENLQTLDDHIVTLTSQKISCKTNDDDNI